MTEQMDQVIIEVDPGWSHSFTFVCQSIKCTIHIKI